MPTAAVLAAGLVGEHAGDRDRVAALQPLGVQVEIELRVAVGDLGVRPRAATMPAAEAGERHGRDAVGERHEPLVVGQGVEVVLPRRAALGLGERGRVEREFLGFGVADDGGGKRRGGTLHRPVEVVAGVERDDAACRPSPRL